MNGRYIRIHSFKERFAWREETKQEILTSLEIIKKELKSDPLFFALAFGTSNNYINSIVKKLGVLGILTTQAKIVSDTTSDTPMLPRILVNDSFLDFMRILNWCYLYFILKTSL